MKAPVAMVLAFLAMASALPPPNIKTSPSIPILASTSSTQDSLTLATDLSPLEPRDGSISRRQVQTWPPKTKENPNDYQPIYGDASKFTCAPAEYFEPDVEIQCDIFKVTTKKGNHRMDFQFFLPPIGVAYSEYGRGTWLAFVKKALLEDTQVLGIIPDNFGVLGEMSSVENNWGTGVRVYVFGNDNDKKKHGSADEVARILEESILPKVVCAEYASSVYWVHEEKCKITETTEGGGD